MDFVLCSHLTYLTLGPFFFFLKRKKKKDKKKMLELLVFGCCWGEGGKIWCHFFYVFTCN
ncbi:hypothetical protein BDV26DRAFT_258069, partial [Aspergillus bertholletiae]